MKKAPYLTCRGVGSDYSQDHRKLRGLYDPNLNACYIGINKKLL